MITATRYHDISCGHRVVGHEGSCARIHGHNYRFHFTCQADELDDIGRVIDFSEIKRKLCDWLDENFDHKFLIWVEDPWKEVLTKLDPTVVWLEFNPTAENIASFFIREIGPSQLKGTGVVLVSCTVDETRKCSATASL